MELITKSLEQIGLSEKQVAVYTTLLSIGRGSAERIARHANIKRTTIYVILDELEKLGLIYTILDKARKLYRPLSPEFLISNKSKELNEVSKIVPQVEAMLRKEGVKDKPRVLYFQGVDGFKRTVEYKMEDLRDGRLKSFMGSTDKETLALFGDYFHQYNKKLLRMNTKEQGISPDTPEVAEFNKDYRGGEKYPNMDIQVLPADLYNPSVSVEIGPAWVKIYDFKNLQSLVIESEAVAESWEQIFNLARMGAEVNSQK